MPILANLLVETTAKNELHLFATDLEIAVSTVCPGQVKEQGKMCVPERKVFDIVKELDRDELEVTMLDNYWAKFKTDKSEFKVIGLNADEYPKAFDGKMEKGFRLERETLMALIDQTIYAVLDADYAQYNGVLMESEKGKLRMVATDGHRLAMHEHAGGDGKLSSEALLVPKKGAKELRRILSELEGDVEVSAGNGYLAVEGKMGGASPTKVMVRLLEGKFPNYREAIPKRFLFDTTMDRATLHGALRRMALLATPLAQGVKLAFSKDAVELSVKNPDVGEASEKVPYEAGERQDGFEILFNVHYVLGAVEVMSDEKLQLKFSGPEGAVLIQPAGGSGALAVVMPMRS